MPPVHASLPGSGASPSRGPTGVPSALSQPDVRPGRLMLARELLSALRDSLPVPLPVECLQRMGTGAAVLIVAKGDHLYREGGGPFLLLILRGLLRAYMTS